MNCKNILLAFASLLFFTSCKKDIGPVYSAEGYVYEAQTRRPLSNIPIHMYECEHTGTRCRYTFVTKVFTDANGYYKISNPRRKKGALSIEVSTNDQTFGSFEFSLLNPGNTYKKDFFVDAIKVITARFIVQTQNRNFALLSINSGLYASSRAIFRNAPGSIDTTLKLRFVANSLQSLAVLLRNENLGTSPPFSDSLQYVKNLGVVAGDTSLVWIVP